MLNDTFSMSSTMCMYSYLLSFSGCVCEGFDLQFVGVVGAAVAALYYLVADAYTVCLLDMLVVLV